MKLSANILYLKPLLLIMGLTACVCATANDAETTMNAPTNVENTAATTPSTAARQDAKASLKNPNALLVAMAFKFHNIEGSPQNYEEVVASYCSAAKSGDADAEYALGWMYENGRGVSADKSIAAQLYGMAATKGHIRAKASLATIAGSLPQSDLPACLKPDPPVTIASTNADPSDIKNASLERKVISNETAALFYSQANILKLVNKLAPRYNIDANLAMAFIAVESGFNVKATSPKNAQGLMQLIPATALRFGVKDAYKAEDNIKGGLAYLQWLLAYFKGDVQLVAAAYNAGEAAVEKYKGVPPYTETKLYVKKIAKLYNNATHPYVDGIAKTSSNLYLANKGSM